MYDKRYVALNVRVDESGDSRPLAIHWYDYDKASLYPIDEILEIKRSPAENVGSGGIRYKIRIRGKVTNLYYEGPRWFVEEERAE